MKQIESIDFLYNWSQEAGPANVDTKVTVSVQFGGVSLIEAMAAEWAALALQTRDDQPFYHAEFLAASTRSSKRGTVVLLSARIGGTLRAVLALLSERGFVLGIPVRRLRSPANALRFDITKAVGREGDDALSAIWQELRQLPFDLIELGNVPETSDAEHLMALAMQDRFPVARWLSKETPHIPLQQMGTRPWLNLARESLVETVDRSRRKMSRELGASPRLDRHIGFQRDLVEQFYKLEAAGWKGRNGTAIMSQPRTLLFHNEIAEVGGRNGYFCIDSLYCNDELVAAAFSFIHRKRYFALKWAYDEKFHKYAPGHLLINAVLERCVNDELTEFDFMGERFDYEKRWTPFARRHNFLYVFQKSIKGRLLERLKFGIVPWLKRWKNNSKGRT